MGNVLHDKGRFCPSRAAQHSYHHLRRVQYIRHIYLIWLASRHSTRARTANFLPPCCRIVVTGSETQIGDKRVRDTGMGCTRPHEERGVRKQSEIVFSQAKSENDNHSMLIVKTQTDEEWEQRKRGIKKERHPTVGSRCSVAQGCHGDFDDH